MFVNFFFEMRDRGLITSPTSFLRFQQAMREGMVRSLSDLYVVARTTMVKSEKLFDLYDRIFAHYFQGAEYGDDEAKELLAELESFLKDWLKDPLSFPGLTDEEKDKLSKMTPEELEKYFLERLMEQKERHDGGNKWIGTGGTSPTGHGGRHPGGMRVGGAGGGMQAIKVAMERRYMDYAKTGVLTNEMMSDAMRRLKHMTPAGPRDQLDIDETIRETVRQAGEIELVFKRRLKDKVKIILMMDNGGYSMSAYVEVCRMLFQHARASFKDLKIFYFHNCIYDEVWADPQRYHKPQKLVDFSHYDPEYKLIVVGDASMAPYELIDTYGNIAYMQKQTRSGRQWLQFLARQFPHAVWLNPKMERTWDRTVGGETIYLVRQIFPMFELSLDGLEKAISHLMAK